MASHVQTVEKDPSSEAGGAGTTLGADDLTKDDTTSQKPDQPEDASVFVEVNATNEQSSAPSARPPVRGLRLTFSVHAFLNTKSNSCSGITLPSPIQR